MQKYFRAIKTPRKSCCSFVFQPDGANTSSSEDSAVTSHNSISSLLPSPTTIPSSTNITAPLCIHAIVVNFSILAAISYTDNNNPNYPYITLTAFAISNTNTTHYVFAVHSSADVRAFPDELL
jgi:hypothetical protein